MGSFITPYCSNCKFPFKQLMVGGGMMNMDSFKIPYSCYDCGTIVLRGNTLSPSICSKCRKELVMFGEFLNDEEFNTQNGSVFEWNVFSSDNEGYVLKDIPHPCPKCKETKLKFRNTGMWD